MATFAKGRFPRVLFFTAGMVPTAEDRTAIAEMGPKAAFRNASLVSDVPTSSIEECDFVAGPAIPARYARTYPAWGEGMTLEQAREVLDRPSDLDLPHATLTGNGVEDPSNEAARAARPPSVNDFVSPTVPRTPGAMTGPHGGTAIPRPAGNTLGMFGAERAENASLPGDTGGSAPGTVSPEDGKGVDGQPVGTNAAPSVAPKFASAGSKPAGEGDDAAAKAKAEKAAADKAKADAAKAAGK